MFIETGNVGLERNDIVRVRLRTNDEEIPARGIIVHTNKAGIGINLIDSRLNRLFEDRHASVINLFSDNRGTG